MTTLTLSPLSPTALSVSPFKHRADENLFNVKDYGALGDNSTDDYVSILAAHTAAVAAGGGTVYFPPGNYRYGTALSITTSNAVSLMGAGQMVSVLKPTFAAGDAISVNGPSLFSMSHLGVVPTLERTQGTYNLHVSNCLRPMVDSVYMNNANGGLFMFESVNFLQMSNCQGDSNNGSTHGDTCLRIKAGGGNITNCFFRTGPAGGINGSAPCLWITGQSTSLHISNSDFAGGGPMSTWTTSAIASDAAKFTVTTTATHDFAVGDFVAIRGASVSTYNNAWRVATVPTATTFTVTSTANPGAASGGTAESWSACALVTNADGAVNESNFSNCLFEGLQTALYGTVSLYFDGRRGTPGARTKVSGWNISSCYFDFGATGLLLSGTAATVANDATVAGFTVAGCVANSSTRGVHIDQANGVTVNGVIPAAGGAPVSDPSGPVGNINAGIYIYSGPSAPYTQGVTITGCNSGAPRNWDTSSTSYLYGLFVDGATNINDLSVTGNQFHGSSLGANYDAQPGAVRWRFESNQITGGAFPPTTAQVLPTVASATNLATNPFHDYQQVSGTTNITNMNPRWPGRKMQLLFQGALTLNSGGTLAGAAYSVLAGQLVTLVCDGTSWYVK